MTAPEHASRPARITGVTLSTLAALLLIADAAGKLARVQPVIDGSVALGYSPAVIVPLGVILLIGTLLYIAPRTAVLGAIILTGYLGGAVATHVRVQNPLFTHALFPVYLGAIIWLGLILRDPVLRSRLPLRARPAC